MKLVHNVRISAFSKPEEDYNQIKSSFLALLGMIPEIEKIELVESTCTGFNDRKIKTLEVILDKNRHCHRFLKHLISILDNKQITTIINQIPSRLDDNLFFFLRLDKQSFINKKVLLTDSGDCFHIRLSIASFPKRKDIASKIIKEIFQN